MRRLWGLFSAYAKEIDGPWFEKYGIFHLSKIHDPNLEIQQNHPLSFAGKVETLQDILEKTRHEKAYHWAADIVRGQSVLEVGCNTGYGTTILAQAAQKVRGIDINPDAIAYARQHMQLSNIEYVVSNGIDIPLLTPPPSYAVIFQLIEHLSNPVEFLTTVKSRMADNGKVLLTTPNGGMRLRKNQKPWNPFHVREYTASELGSLLTDVFGSCKILGLFGVPVAHERERRRVRQTNSKIYLVEPMKRLFRWYSWWPRIQHRAHKHLGMDLGPPKAEAWAYSLDCFYLSDQNLHDALDFYAVAPSHKVIQSNPTQ